MLMSIQYANTDGKKVFHEFLRCEYSDENILFWNACEEFKKESNQRKMEEKAESIYTDYISILSPKEVSASSCTIQLCLIYKHTN